MSNPATRTSPSVAGMNPVRMRSVVVFPHPDSPSTTSGGPPPAAWASSRAAQPAAKGTLEMIHGPQRIAIPPAQAHKITIKFLNSYGGFNPGAAEIMVFGQELSRADVGRVWPQDRVDAPVRRALPPPDELLRVGEGRAAGQNVAATYHSPRVEQVGDEGG